VRVGAAVVSLVLLAGLAPSVGVRADVAEPVSAPHRSHPTLERADTIRDPKTGSAGACGTCHSAIAREWAGSSHHRSASNEHYTAAVEREPLAFCRGCHAPSGDASYSTSRQTAAFESGIGCTTCHEGMKVDHASSSAERHSSAKTCASCHEFSFPTSPALMQKTNAEHAVSAFASTACESCHMPPSAEGKSHRSHRFDVAPLVTQALVADVSRASPTRIAFRLAPGEIGHSFPTGDLFRRLSVRVEAADGRVLSEKFLARHFRSIRGTNVEQSDDRVGAPGLARCFELEVKGLDRAVPLVASIALEHVEMPRREGDRAAVVSARIPVFRESFPSQPETFRPCP